MKATIRSAVPADLPRICEISADIHRTSYAALIPKDEQARFLRHFSSAPDRTRRRVRRLRQAYDDKSWHIWVAEVNGTVVGYAKEQRTDDKTIMKKGLFVTPDYQGKGIGSALFEASLSAAKPGDTVLLSVIEGNERARRLYEKYGFTASGGERRTFYGAPLVTMMLTVD